MDSGSESAGNLFVTKAGCRLNVMHGLADRPAVARGAVPRHRMACVENRRVVGEPDVLFTVPCAMVRNRATQARCCASIVLVAEPGWGNVAVCVCAVLQARFGVYFCVRVHVDTVRAEPRHSPPHVGIDASVQPVRTIVRAASQLLLELRSGDRRVLTQIRNHYAA